MIQQIYDNNFGSTHEFNIKGSVFAETGGHWNLIVPNSVFFNNYKKMNYTLTCQRKPCKCLERRRHGNCHKRLSHIRRRVWMSDQRMQCLGISEWKTSVNEKQTQIQVLESYL